MFYANIVPMQFLPRSGVQPLERFAPLEVNLSQDFRFPFQGFGKPPVHHHVNMVPRGFLLMPSIAACHCRKARPMIKVPVGLQEREQIFSF